MGKKNETKTIKSRDEAFKTISFEDGTASICTDKAWKFAENIKDGTECTVGFNKLMQVSLIHATDFEPNKKEFVQQRMIPDTDNQPDLNYLLDRVSKLEAKIDHIIEKIDTLVPEEE